MKKTQQVRKTNPRKLQPRKRKKRFTPLTFFFLSILLFVITTGVSYVYFRPIFAFKSSHIKKDIEKTHPKSKYDTERDIPRRLYRAYEQRPLIWYDTRLRKATTIVTIEDAIRSYIKPYGVRLLDLYMDKEGIVYIDLGDEIRKNFKGDAYEEYSLIAGLYKRIKRSAGSFSAIKLLIEGKEAESIGGHIDISRPIGEEIAVPQ